MNIIFADVADYGELLATMHKDILHTAQAPRFFRSWDEAEAYKAKIKQVEDKAILVMDETGLRGLGSNHDNNHRERTIPFFILKMCFKKDAKFIDAAANSCEQIHNDFIGKMRYDKEEGTNDNILSQFDPNNYNGERIGPLFDNWYGYMFEHRFQSNVNLEYDATKWL